MDRKEYLYKLINSCPFTDTVNNCPIERLRRLSIKELIKTMKSLPDYEVIIIIQQHIKCKREREKAEQFKSMKHENREEKEIKNEELNTSYTQSL